MGAERWVFMMHMVDEKGRTISRQEGTPPPEVMRIFDDGVYTRVTLTHHTGKYKVHWTEEQA
jgi:hypothetical protein